jgi:O-antigen/teichoic acid export membrane protein
MSEPDQEPVSGVPLLELTHTGGPAPSGEAQIDDEVAAVLSSRDAGGAAVRGGAVRVAGYVLNALLGAVGAAFLFRHLGVEGAGSYVTAMSIAAIVAGLSDLGLTALGVRELSVREPEARNSLMANLLGLRIAMTLAGIAGSLVFALIAGYKAVVVAGVALAGAGLMFQNTQSTLALSMVSRLKLGLLTATEVGRQLLTTVLTITFVALGFSLLWFIGLTVPVALLFLIVTAWLVRHEVPLLPRINRAEWRALVVQVLPYSAAVALAVIYFRLSVIFVSLITDPKELGYFATSFRIIEVLIVVPGLMVTGVFPIFAHAAIDEHERFAYAISRVVDSAMIIGAWFALALALGAPIAIRAVSGGGEFSQAIGVLRIQAIGLGASFVGAVWGMAMLSLRLNRQLVLVNLGGLVLGSVLVVALASTYGAEGAAAGTAITEVLLAGLVPFVLARARPDIMPSMRTVFRVLPAAGLGAAIALVPGLPTTLQVLGATVIYAAVLFATGAVPEELLIELRAASSPSRWRARS